MNKLKGALIVIVVAVVTAVLFLYFFARSTLTSIIRYISGKAGYVVYGTGEKVIGTPQEFTVYQPLVVTDGLTTGQTAGIRMYQKTGVGATNDVAKALNDGDIKDVITALTAINANPLYAKISWNFTNENMFRDTAIGVVFTVTDGVVTPQDVIDRIANVPWMQTIMKVMDFDVQSWQLS